MTQFTTLEQAVSTLEPELRATAAVVEAIERLNSALDHAVLSGLMVTLCLKERQGIDGARWPNVTADVMKPLHRQF